MEDRRKPVTTIEELVSLDSYEVIAGYADGRANEPCGDNRSRDYWHGWRNGQIDKGFMAPDAASRALAAAYIGRRNPPYSRDEVKPSSRLAALGARPPRSRYKLHAP